MMQNSELLIEQVKYYKPQSSATQLEEFLKSTLYMDFKNEMLARIENMRDAYEVADSKTYIETKGGIRAMREQAITVFEFLLDNRKSDDRGGDNG